MKRDVFCFDCYKSTLHMSECIIQEDICFCCSKGISNFSYFVLFLSLLHLARTLFQYWHEASLRICIQMIYFTKISSSSYVCILWEVSVIVSSGWMPLWAFLWWGLGRGLHSHDSAESVSLNYTHKWSHMPVVCITVWTQACTQEYSLYIK